MEKTGKAHNVVVRNEFTRQSKSMQNAKIFTDKEILNKIKAATLRNGRRVRVLDLGCGPGIVTSLIAPEVYEVVALDLTPGMIELARQRCNELGLTNVRFEVGQAEKLPFGDRYFDIVVTRLTLHHFLSPHRAILEMTRVLKVKGLAVVADIVSSGNSSEAELHNAIEMLRDPSHVRALSEEELEKVIESADLKIIGRDSWVNEREFGEWISITNAPERERPLFTVMKALAEAGVTAGVNLRFDGLQVMFDHSWALITAQMPG
jgi:ubiquinone/menaquinone biosynthesis C-methylase UbiE